MMHINIINYASGRHFDEIIGALVSGFSSFCEVKRCPHPLSHGINIILGANVLALRAERIIFPPNSILYNLEQLGHNALWDATFYLDYLLAYPVIDYSTKNIEYLKERGKKSEVLFLPIRYSEAFGAQLPRHQKKSIDVGLIGAQSPRRDLIVKSLRRNGVSVAYATECWGEDRDRFLARTKIILNIRSSKSGLLETTRLVSLLSSGINCISESSDDSSEDAYFSQFMELVPFESLVATVLDKVRADSPSPSLQEFSKDSYSHRIAKLVPRIAAAIDGHQTVRADIKPAQLISNGFYLTARAKIIEEDTAARTIMPLLDYVLNQHDRIHDVIDTLPLETTVPEELLTVYLELYCEKWLPEQIKISIKDCLLKLLTRSSNRDLNVPDYTGKLILKFLAGENEIYLFLKYFPANTVHFCLALRLLETIEVPKIAWLDSATRVATSAHLPPEIALHVAAEMFWRAKANYAAAECYRKARLHNNLSSDIYFVAGDRLGAYGDYILAQTYYEKAGPAGHDDNGLKAMEQSNRVSSAPAPLFDLGKLTFALERSSSEKVQVAAGTATTPPTLFVGGKHAVGLKNPVLNGSIKVFDRRLPVISGKPVKAVAIVACYNEIDVIEAAIRRMLMQGVQVHIVDNWSNDGTYELLEILQSELSFELERYPNDGPAEVYDWSGLLSRKEEIAHQYQGYWIVHSDADEIRISPWQDIDLASAFAVVEAYGCNAIDYVIANFRPVDDGFAPGMDMEEYFKYFEVASSNDLRYQIKTWRQGPERVDLVGRGGHYVQFPGMKVFPYKFICKHYPLRSLGHASKKINFDRVARFSPSERAKGWHSHYDNINPMEVIHDWTALHEWSDESYAMLTPHLIQGV